MRLWKARNASPHPSDSRTCALGERVVRTAVAEFEPVRSLAWSPGGRSVKDDCHAKMTYQEILKQYQRKGISNGRGAALERQRLASSYRCANAEERHVPRGVNLEYSSDEVEYGYVRLVRERPRRKSNDVPTSMTVPWLAIATRRISLIPPASRMKTQSIQRRGPAEA